jgi:small subunit ribosomal protein S6
MLVLRPDAPDDRVSALIDRTTRQIVADGGQIVKVAPWGRRRLAYPIERYREGSYHILVFDAPSPALIELERGLLITEDVIRHLVTRSERPAKPPRRDAATTEAEAEVEGVEEPVLPADEDEDELAATGEQIDESESEAAPAAID